MRNDAVVANRASTSDGQAWAKAQGRDDSKGSHFEEVTTVNGEE